MSWAGDAQLPAEPVLSAKALQKAEPVHPSLFQGRPEEAAKAAAGWK